MAKAYFPLIDPMLLLNIDATTFYLEFGKDGAEVWVPEERDDSRNVKRRASKGMNLFIKYYLLMNSLGTISNDVYVCSDKSLPVDECVIEQVPGLSPSNQSGAKGHLVIMKDRSGNEKFFEWLYLTYCVDFVNKLRRDYDLYESDSTPKRALLTMDGEEVQIRIFKTEAAQKLLEENRITVIKLAASTSSVQQPCDVCRAFQSTKKTLKSIKYVAGFPLLEKELRRILSLQAGIDGDTKRKIREGLVTITHAHQYASYRSLYANGWVDSGLYPLDTMKILKKCMTKLEDEEYEEINSKLEVLSKIFREHGQLTEDVMTEQGIPEFKDPKERRTKPKHERAIQNQRVVCLTSIEVLEGLRRKREAEEAAGKKKVETKEGKESLIPSHFVSFYAAYTNPSADWRRLNKQTLSDSYYFIRNELGIEKNPPPLKKSATKETYENALEEMIPSRKSSINAIYLDLTALH